MIQQRNLQSIGHIVPGSGGPRAGGLHLGHHIGFGRGANPEDAGEAGKEKSQLAGNPVHA